MKAKRHRSRRRIAVRHPRGRELVAVVELVSPGNKASRREFADLLDKSVLLLRQGVHLTLIDPFLPTARDPRGLHVAVWAAVVGDTFTPPAGKPLTLVSYAAGPDLVAHVDPVAVGDVLPDVPLFLTPGIHVPLPLEATYAVAWATLPAALRRVVEGRDETPG